MSRSFRKSKVFSQVLVSDKGSKAMRFYRRQRAHIERMKLRDALAHEDFDNMEAEYAPWDEWDCPRDGMKYYGDAPEEWMRK